MYVDIKYLNLLSTQLERFKQKKPTLWNFRCPYCGDSEHNKNKARGFVFQHKGDLLYKCHNCQISVPFPKLLQDLNLNLYKEYRLEKFTSPKQKVDMRKVNRVVSQKPMFKTNILSELTPLTNLNKSHPAKEYLLRRKLPIEALYFTEKFKEWTNSVKPDTFQDTSTDEGRIIIPFKDKEGNVFGFQGRSLSNSGIRYITILLQEDEPKIFGLDKLNYEDTAYVTEGPFDSMLLVNALAMAGADGSLPSSVLHPVYVYDNEPRNRAITDKIEDRINNGDSVVIWPSSVKEKDINDMFLAGHDVQKLVSDNTTKGLPALMKFKQWRK